MSLSFLLPPAGVSETKFPPYMFLVSFSLVSWSSLILGVYPPPLTLYSYYVFLLIFGLGHLYF